MHRTTLGCKVRRLQRMGGFFRDPRMARDDEEAEAPPPLPCAHQRFNARPQAQGWVEALYEEQWVYHP